MHSTSKSVFKGERIAQDEILAGKVKWEIPETRSAAEQASESLDKALGQD